MPRIVRFHKTGGPEVLELEDLPEPRPGPGEALIRVEACALNRADLMLREGTYIGEPVLPSRLGYDAAGVVKAIGEGVAESSPEITPASRVMTLPGFSPGTHGVFGDWAIVPADCLLPLPKGLAFTMGAAAGVPLWTAWLGLREVADLTRGERVVITAASSACGIAAMQVAKSLGAEIIATTRSAAKAASLKALGASEVVVAPDGAWGAAVQESVGEVQVVFDAVFGGSLGEACAALGPFGRLISYGSLERRATELEPRPIIAKSLQLRGFKVFDYTGLPALGLPRRSEAVEAARAGIEAGLGSGELAPFVAKVFDLSEIVEATRSMESNQGPGRIVLRCV